MTADRRNLRAGLTRATIFFEKTTAEGLEY
jgi:hypothetical protein